ncbi:MAG TPA: glycosyltransferase family 4 protein [Verrucomicrobiae bacterium]|jgi:glycosyltransferase involved in cell wall biosynthesis
MNLINFTDNAPASPPTNIIPLRIPLRKVRLCQVGPMVGRNAGHVTTQGEILTDGLRREGYPVISISAQSNRYLRLLDVIWTLLRHGRQIDVQWLHIYGGPSFVVEDIASLFGRLFGQRIIMHLHGGNMPQFMARHPQWTRRVLRRADAFAAPSPFLARAIESYGFHGRVIPNVIDLALYPYRHRGKVSPRLFWMRSFQQLWNPLMAVRVLARLRESWPDATLVMGGEEKGMLAETKALAQQLGVARSIYFPGFLNMEDKAREGTAADIFINTNHIDNMPVAVVEACAMGLPVVATSVGGIPDLLQNDETGLLVPDDDDAAMAAAVDRLCRQPGLASKLSCNGRQLAERSSWAQVLPQWHQLITEVMSNSGRQKGRTGLPPVP